MIIETLVVHTDGGARGNGTEDSLGAWAYTAFIDGEEVFDYQAETNTTNNIQEMNACIEALKMLLKKGIKHVEIHSDSAYTINGISNWIYGWEKNGWKRGKNRSEEIKNLELWKEMHHIRNHFDDVKFVKVKGHSTNEGNNRADELVNQAMDEYLKK